MKEKQTRFKKKELKRAEELIELGEYDNFSIRSIAKDCGIAVGTLYNYFKSKDELLVAVIDEHWCKMIGEVDERCDNSKTLTDCVCHICTGIRSFAEGHTRFWISSIMGGFSYSTGTEWKRSLRRTVQERFERHAQRLGYKYDPTLSPAVAEVIISLGAQIELDFDVAIRLLRQATSKIESIGADKLI